MKLPDDSPEEQQWSRPVTLLVVWISFALVLLALLYGITVVAKWMVGMFSA